MRTWVCWILFLSGICEVYAQGKGGGIYLHNDAKCIGSVIYYNQAEDGFGVAGGNAAVVNTTVIGNIKIVQDTSRISPGYIYCADGEIVDTVAYRQEGRTNAIGIVFWVRGDVNATYPKGAVVALQEKNNLSWGSPNILNINGQYEGEEWYGVSFLKDTACYGNTLKIEEKYKEGYNTFEAGHYCYTYTAPGQEAGNPHWCMPVYLYLRRIFSALPAIEASLDFLQRCHPDWKIDAISGKDSYNAWYWSSNDGASGEKDQVCVVNFVTGAMGQKGSLEAAKNGKNNVRPVFVY